MRDERETYDYCHACFNLLRGRVCPNQGLSRCYGIYSKALVSSHVELGLSEFNIFYDFLVSELI